MTVADNATLNNNGVYIVGEQKTLTIDGTLRNQGQLDVRGTVHLRAGEIVYHNNAESLLRAVMKPDGSGNFGRPTVADVVRLVRSLALVGGRAPRPDPARVAPASPPASSDPSPPPRRPGSASPPA